VSTEDAAWLEPLAAAATRDLVEMSRPALRVGQSVGCVEVEEIFSADASLSSIVVDGDDGQVGIITRAHLGHVLSGRLGFGRVLNQRRSVGTVADWAPLVLASDTDLTTAATRILTHPGERWQDVLVRAGDELRVAPSAAIMQALAGAFMTRASHDDLTGLPNRARFLERLQEVCREAGSHADRAVAVLFVDLDDFKQINDGLGHEAGDEALRDAAHALSHEAQPGDMVARLGGDEFAAILDRPFGPSPAEVVEDAARAAEGFRVALSDEAGLRASIGTAVSRAGAADAEELLREADLAMYAAKNVGGGRVVISDPDHGHLTLTESGALHRDPDHQIREAIERALHEDELTLYYQPIVSLDDFAFGSVEALLRWNHPTRGLLSPAQFLHDAARLGLADEVDLWVVDRALADFARWRASGVEGVPPWLNVNLSRQVLERADLHERVMASLHRHGVPSRSLRLELVEDTDPELLTRAAPQLNALRDDGVSLTWDDMGSGSSSLKQVTQIDVDGLKIDRAFISEIETNPSAHAVVRMLILLANAMELQVTAEGVETPEQLRTITGLGATYAQGFLLARPTPADSLLDVVRAWRETGRATALGHGEEPTGDLAGV
jgi:diguanylate cyclase (GGDEF)-like protein